MITVTGTSQQAAWQRREAPPVEQVRDSVWSIPVDCGPLPIRYTFAYAVIGARRKFVLIDPGLKGPSRETQLRDGLRVAGLEVNDLVGIIATHCHADHMSGATSLQAESGAWFGMHELEPRAYPGWPNDESVLQAHNGLLDFYGVPGVAERPGHMDAAEYAFASPIAMPDRHIQHGQHLDLPGRNIEVVWTPGHTAGHLSLLDHDEHLAFTGDHILPRITPNVSAYPHDPEADALGDYLRSLDLMSAWDEYEACPAHEYRFLGLRARVEQLRKDAENRSAEVRAAMASGRSTAWEIAQVLTWRFGWESLDGVNLRAALGETQAHINYLQYSSSAPAGTTYNSANQ